jgi:hypothetical protein
VSAHLRAFVVQFRANANVAEGRVSGRVEHVRTGDAEHFGSLAELLAFIEHGLVADADETGDSQ